MKKYLIFILLGCFYFSCSKNNKSTPPPVKPPSNKTYAVHFNVNATGASTLQTNSLHTADATPVPVSSFANVLYYWVYNSAGKLITTLTQTGSTTNFGQITDTYTTGTYHVVILAQNRTANSTTSPVPPKTFSSYCTINGNDSFFDTSSLIVTNTAVDQSITLQRVVGQLQVVITDSIPAAATQIAVNITPYQDLEISAGTPVTENDSYPIIITLPDSVKGKTNFTITTYVTNTPVTPFKTVITGYDIENTIIAAATVDSVTCQTNTRTILSGALFTHEANLAFTVSLNDVWNSNPTIIPFIQRKSFTKPNF